MLLSLLLHSYKNIYVCVHVVVARHEFVVAARRGQGWELIVARGGSMSGDGF